MRNHVLSVGTFVTLALIPGIASAACPADTSSIAGLWLTNPPTSGPDHYVQQVLDRTDPAITAAAGASGGPFDAITSLYWGDHAKRFVYEALSAEQELFNEAKNLRDVTACLHVDLRIIDSQMEKARCELNSAYERNAIGAMWRMGMVIRFLAQSREHLYKGATDPSYVDDTWSTLNAFDSDARGWCCITDNKDPSLLNVCLDMDTQDCFDEGGTAFKNEQGCLEAAIGCDKAVGSPPTADESICPFHSNYLPPTATFVTSESRTIGLGCSVEVLSALPSLFTPIQEEYDGLNALMDDRDEFIDFAVAKSPVLQSMSNRMGLPYLIPREIGQGKRSEIERREFRGCLKDIPSWTTGTPGLKSTNVVYQRGGSRWAPRGKFSLYPNEILLMQNLSKTYFQWGNLREQADFIKLPVEVWNPTPDPDLIDQIANFGAFPQRLRDEIREAMAAWNKEQSVLEGAIKVRTGANHDKLWEMVRGPHESLTTLGQVVSQKDQGIRQFTTGMAYYMARSCIFRPCVKNLKRVLKINLEDSCFPYVDGSYLGDDTPWETCSNAADLSSI